MIATAPRTGSSLLAEALTATRRVGAPDEFFDVHPRNEMQWIGRFNIPEGASYIDHVEAATRTQNGVFGFKLHWHQMPALANRLVQARSDAASLTGRPVFDLIQHRFPDMRFILLGRRNKIAQAISYFRASDTNVWRLWNDNRPPQSPAKKPEYNRAGIERHLRMVLNMDAGWRRFFADHEISPLVLTYEDFVQSYAQTVQSVLSFLGLRTDDLVLPPPALRRLADTESEEWERRFRAEQAPVPVRLPAAVPEPETKPVSRVKPTDGPLPLIGYDVGSPMKTTVVPGGPTRAWMNATPNRFAYRCLPMVIANQWGWMIETSHRVEAVWDGSHQPAGLVVTSDAGDKCIAASHFGSGVLTFHVAHLFRTPPGYNMHVRGPANMPKDGICALEGIVETDWMEATFTMNWKLTRPNHPVVFEAGEPIAMISPVRRNELERFVP
jgi:LPS sulfotransferase NodH